MFSDFFTSKLCLKLSTFDHINHGLETEKNLQR